MAEVNLADYDRYGFKVESQHVSRQQWEKMHATVVNSDKKHLPKWDALFRSNRGELPERSDKIKKLIRKGVPTQFRRKVWLKYSGALDRMDMNPGVYLAMVGRERQQIDRGVHPVNEFVDIIERDLNRTFPDNLYFRADPPIAAPAPPYWPGNAAPDGPISLIASLRRVLVAFSFFNAEIGYCQSLNYIVGLLLLFMSEEEAFWTLVVITENLLPAGMYTKTLSGTITEMKVFKDIVKDKCKPILTKVKEGGIVELDMLTSPWFLTLYINVLPNECVLRLWDTFFYEGSKILYRIALAVLKLIESDVIKLKDAMEVVQYIQTAPKRMTDVDKLMKAAFQRFGSKAVGHLSHHDIDRKRNEASAALNGGSASPSARPSTSSSLSSRS
ncbi:hypothetical protein AMAG_17334 [Allomyces macrogynus ATCC 38327]|uniref:Rab-GAP TBC domain-containing protein n=3 Tax=Allomyces macrogynus (strain ATCC 38327) TaxID=578462 RepID=A0A0L0TER4_ALLM3|nr:hypothetical protein AMAG_17334 [Allomyces macrogynus ATCC 38327]|eukprot:KNE73069.1 hypothetical protein AMAG_17334 [Allomyces macrogynus ATCC 38327]